MKLTKYILSFAAAAGLLAACQTPELVQVAAPENVIPAALHELEVDEIAITATNQKETIKFSWEEADYGAKTSLRYSVEAALTEDGKKVTIVPGTADTTATVTYEELNRVIFNDLEVPEGQPTELKIYVGSVIYSGAVTASYPKVYSQPISLTVTVTAAEKVYPTLTVAGSYAYNSWTPGKGQFVYDFEGNGAQYSGVIDFGEDVSALEFKFVGKAWGTDEYSVASGTEQAAEAASLTLVSGGGDNISAYRTHRYYSLTLDTAAPKVTKNFSFNSLGVIGDATPTGWDADTDMIFNADKQRFYVDLTLTDGTIKFRVDDDWALNWGVTNGAFVSGGDNIAVTAGNYRIYVNLNDPANPTYELNAGMYGKDEPTSGTTTPETPETPDTPAALGWGIIGAFSGWGEQADVMLASDGTYLVAKGVALSGQFKFRKDGDWAVNFGAPGDVEPVDIAVNTELALVANGKNFNIAEGTYDVYLDEANAKAWFINDGSYPGGGAAPEASEWGVVGVVTGWADHADITMYKTATEGLFVAYKVDMPAGGFKIRANGVWNDAANYGLATAGPVEVDHVYDLVCSGGSGDMTLVAGTYDIWFDLTNSKVYIMTPGKPISEAVGGGATPPTPPTPTDDVWGLVGTITNWADKADINLVAEGDWLVAKGIALTTSDEFKFRTNGTWGTERTATTADPVAINTEYEAAAGSGNIKVAVAGTYDIYLAKTLDKFYVMEQGLTPGQTPGQNPDQPEFEPQASEWGVVGDVNGWNAPDITMYTTPTEGLFVARDVNMPAGGFKIRANNSWDDTKNYGLESAGNVEVDHVYNVITSGGSGNMTVVAGTYDIWFDLTNTKVYIMTPGKDISEAKSGTAVAPLTDTWYLVGDFNGWKPADATYKMTAEGEWYVFKNFKADGKGMKFVGDANWQNERVGTFNSANTAISVAKGSGNMFPTAGTYDVYLSADTKTAYFMTPGTKPAN